MGNIRKTLDYKPQIPHLQLKNLSPTIASKSPRAVAVSLMMLAARLTKVLSSHEGIHE